MREEVHPSLGAECPEQGACERASCWIGGGHAWISVACSPGGVPIDGCVSEQPPTLSRTSVSERPPTCLPWSPRHNPCPQPGVPSILTPREETGPRDGMAGARPERMFSTGEEGRAGASQLKVTLMSRRCPSRHSFPPSVGMGCSLRASPARGVVTAHAAPQVPGGRPSAPVWLLLPTFPVRKEQGSERVGTSLQPHSPLGRSRAAAGASGSPGPSLCASLASGLPSPPLSALCPRMAARWEGAGAWTDKKWTSFAA